MITTTRAPASSRCKWSFWHVKSHEPYLLTASKLSTGIGLPCVPVRDNPRNGPDVKEIEF